MCEHDDAKSRKELSLDEYVTLFEQKNLIMKAKMKVGMKVMEMNNVLLIIRVVCLVIIIGFGVLAFYGLVLKP